MDKRIMSFVFAIALLVFSCASGAQAAPTGVATAATDTGHDVVIIIDRSGTMKRNDARGIALVAANNLIDIFDKSSTSVAVIGYGYSVTYESDFVDLSDSAEVARLKGEVNQIGIIDRDDTHTDLALAEAKRLIDDRRALYPDHSFELIVLSDGKIDVGDSQGFLADHGKLLPLGDYSNPERLNYIRQYQQAAKQTADDCAADGVGIYCVGIYSDDIGALGTDMERWTQLTNGAYLTTNDINEVPRLVMDLKNTITGDESIALSDDGRFHIDAGLLEVTITVIPGIDPNNLQLWRLDESGVQQGKLVIDPNDVSNDDPGYTVVTLTRPDEGDYRIVTTDGRRHDYQITINANRMFAMRLSAPQSMRNQEQRDDIVLTVARQGMPYHDAGQAQPVLWMVDPNGHDRQLGQMQWDDARKNYAAAFKPTQTGVYTLYATLTAGGLTSLSNKVTVHVGKASLKKNADIGSLAFTGMPLIIYNARHDPLPGYSEDDRTIRNIRAFFDDPDNVGIDHIAVAFANPSDSQYADFAYDEAADAITVSLKAATPAGGVGFNVTAYDRDGIPSESPVTGTLIIENNARDVQVVQAQYDELKGDMSKGAIEIKAILPQGRDKPGTTAIGNLLVLFEDPNYFIDAATGEPFEAFEVRVQKPETGAVAFGADSPERTVDFEVRDGKELVLWGLREGETELVIRATGYDYSEAEIAVTVRVVNWLRVILSSGAIALAAVFVLALVVRAVVLANAPRFAKGSMMEIRYSTEEDESEGSCMLYAFGRGPAKMAALCTRAGVSANGVRKILENVKVVPRKARGSVELRYKLNGSKGTVTLSNNSDYELTLDKDRNRALRLTYRMEDEEY